MTHIWLRAETRANEKRAALTPQGAEELIKQDMKVTVEDTTDRVFSTDAYRKAGCEIKPRLSWRTAPDDAIILGLKELHEGDDPLKHRHIMFAHAFKGQHAGAQVLRRFKAGGGILYDLEYLVDESGRRVAAFGYWAGYVGAAVTLLAWACQKKEKPCPSVDVYNDKAALLKHVRENLSDIADQDTSAIVIGALGRVGRGVTDICKEVGIQVTQWDIAETTGRESFPEILTHDLFFNCVLANAETPVFFPKAALTLPRRLTAIGDISCDPDSDYNPIPVYNVATSWSVPVIRAHDTPPLDVMAIDNLPSLLPLESALDFAEQLLPHLKTLNALEAGVWGRSRDCFQSHI